MKKHLIFLTSILATTVLSSIGFATWIITGNSEVNAGGNAVVDDISDARLGISYKWANGDSTDNYQSTSFIFGWNGTVNASDWLVNDNNDKIEKLSDTLNITISNVKYLDKLEFSFGLDLSSYTKEEDKTKIQNNWNHAITGDEYDNETFIVAPTLTYDPAKLSINDGTYALNVAFSWGTIFGGKNPYTYYNGESFGDTIANEAKDRIGKLKEYLEGVKFILTIKATAKTTTAA